MVEKYYRIAKCIDRWLTMEENNTGIKSYCLDNNISTVGVYGYGIIGRHLTWLLENEKIEVKWIMDKRNLNKDKININVIGIDEISIVPVDIIIVTAINDYDRIENQLCKKTTIPVISFEAVIDEIENFNMTRLN